MTRVLYFSRSYRVYFKGRTSTRKNIAFWISKRVATRKQFSKCHEEDISVFPPTFSFEAYMNLHQAWRLFCRNHLRSLKSFNSLDRVGYQHQHVSAPEARRTITLVPSLHFDFAYLRDGDDVGPAYCAPLPSRLEFCTRHTGCCCGSASAEALLRG